ncbi:calcium-activated chloride channel regulator 1-like [Haemaphysalis longicornis]
MGRALVVATALLSFLRAASSIQIDVADGGYEDILVSVSTDVPYNESIVENIMALFQSSSEFLHQATHGRVYFKKVTIELPITWPKRASARPISESTFTKADVRVEMPTGACGDKPFTVQVDDCGKPGEFIQVTPGFLAQTQNTAARSNLHAAYVFVHEWAHFRYGVFDEYGSPSDSKYPLTYCIGEKVFLNACSRGIYFTARNANGGRCSVDGNCRIVGDCTVEISQPARTPVESSIMFMPYVANASQFCDDNDEHRRHNRFAPNMQNEICNQRPTWEVISGNDDFKGLPKPDMSKRIQVTFQEKQQKKDLGRRVVLVLDVSQSMARDGRLKFLKEAVTRYISDIEDSPQRLAIVTFSDDAKIRHPLMAVNAATRQGFLDTAAGLHVEGRTCIGCGLQTAFAVLNTSSEKPEGAVIVLFTDGHENRPLYIADVKSLIEKAKITVSTVALGVTVDSPLKELAIATKGKAISYEDITGNLGLQLETAFVTGVTTQVDDNLPVLTVALRSPK